jgi:hypothetical protein
MQFAQKPAAASYRQYVFLLPKTLSLQEALSLLASGMLREQGPLKMFKLPGQYSRSKSGRLHPESIERSSGKKYMDIAQSRDT